MKTSAELRAELKRQAAQKQDMLVPITAMSMNDDNTLAIRDEATLIDTGDVEMSNVAHQQMAAYLGIHRSYYNKAMEERPDILARDVNEWLAHQRTKTDEVPRRLIRTFTGGADNDPQVRAMLSPKYRILDNIDMLQRALPIFEEKKVVPFRTWMSESRMRLTLTSEELTEVIGADLPGDHKVHRALNHKLIAVLTLGNSEVGRGGLSCGISIVVDACANLYMNADTFAKVHVGREIGSNGEIDIYEDETIAAENEVTWLKFRDVIRTTFTRERFVELVEKFRTSRDVTVEKPVPVIKMISKRESLPEDHLLEAFMAEPEPTAFGLGQALTLAAQRVEDEATQVRMAKLGNKAIEAASRKNGEWESFTQNERRVPLKLEEDAD